MNNYRKVYRVEHGLVHYKDFSAIGVGPYHFASNPPANVSLEALVKLREYLYKYEPYEYQLKALGQYKPNKTLPASDRWVRPGPREDTLLRDYLKRNYLSNPNDASSQFDFRHSNDPFIFAFDSMEQLYRWFFCPEERKALAKLGFIIKIHKFKSEAVVIGRSQCICKVGEVYNRANAFIPMIRPLAESQIQNEHIHPTTRNST